MRPIDEPRTGSPEEEDCYYCSRCGKYVPISDGADHSESHYEQESLEEKRPMPIDPVVRAFWEGWEGAHR